MVSDQKFTLYYFNVTGKGELIRWMLAHSKTNWEDKRFDFKDWPNFKEAMPLKQVPCLEWDCPGGSKAKLCQAGAIVHMLARKFDMEGQTACHAAKADECFEAIREIHETKFKIHFEKDEERKKEMVTKLSTADAPRVFSFLENRVKENGGKNLTGSESYTYADIYAACFFDFLSSKPALFDQKTVCPMLLDMAKKIETTEGIKAYIANRPKTDF